MRLGLLIGYGSQLSSLPVPVTKRRYNREGGGRGNRGGGGEVVVVECNGVKTPNRLSDAAHLLHGHTPRMHKNQSTVLLDSW